MGLYKELKRRLEKEGIPLYTMTPEQLRRTNEILEEIIRDREKTEPPA